MPHLLLYPLSKSSDSVLLGIPTSEETRPLPHLGEESVVDSDNELVGIFDEDDEDRGSEESEDEGEQRTTVVSTRYTFMNAKFTSPHRFPDG